MKTTGISLLLTLFCFSLQAQESLTLSLPQRSASTGETVCLDVTTADFEQLLSMQYSLQWDPHTLEFAGVQSLGLPGLSSDNFGTNQTARGILTFLWLDMSLKGLSLPDGHSLFQICFRVVGKPGQSSFVAITEKPTPIEVVNTREQVIGLNPVQGQVDVQ